MSALQRHKVFSQGEGTPMVFVHGFGCDQSMWRLLAPHFAENHKVVLLDLVGSGQSDLAAYSRERHGTLQGHADDICEVIEAAVPGQQVILVGHSVSAMIGMLANISRPELFKAQVMVGPSPCYINDGDYIGGFERKDIDGLLETMESNYMGWSSTMAPAIMGAPDQPQLGQELTNSFCRTDPDIATHFARVTFLSDHRADLPKLQSPTLVLQCSDDMIAPQSVGRYMQEKIPNCTLEVIENIGHCPHLSAPGASADAIEAFLRAL